MKVGIVRGLLIVVTFTGNAAEVASVKTNKTFSIFDIFRPKPKTNSATLGTNIISIGTNSAPQQFNSIPSSQLTAGLKEAIATGLTHAVAILGTSNGFLTNLNVHIPVPSQLATIEKSLRKLGQDALVDEFEATLNHAAEQAVPVATSIFMNSLKQMTVADAATLLQSDSKTAATEYFRKTTTNELITAFLPIVQKATDQAGVTAAYKNLLDKAPFAKAFIARNFEIDHYVTAHALDGLFTMVADEEKRIRENPQARVTTLLQKVFGALQKSK